jgi:hypothetical protein
VEVNALGTTYLLKEALHHLHRQGYGNAVYTGAMAVTRPRPGISVYRATKSYGTSLVESLAEAQHNNRIEVMQLQSAVSACCARTGGGEARRHPRRGSRLGVVAAADGGLPRLLAGPARRRHRHLDADGRRTVRHDVGEECSGMTVETTAVDA